VYGSKKGLAIEYKYNNQGKPDTIKTAGTIVIMAYDRYGNQTQLIDPSAGTIQYHYNYLNQMDYQIDANGVRTDTATKPNHSVEFFWKFRSETLSLQ